MRKVLLLLTTLLLWIAGSVPVLADASDYLSTTDNIVVVTATSAGRGALTASEDGTYLHSASYTGLTMSTTDEASYLVFYPAGNDYYYLYSVDAGAIVNGVDGELTQGSGDALLFTIGDLTGGYGYTGYAILESSGLRYNLGGSYQTTIDSWGTSSGWSAVDDDGNSFTFEIIDYSIDATELAEIIAENLDTIEAAQAAEEEELAALYADFTNSNILRLQFDRSDAYLTYSESLGDLTHSTTVDDSGTTQQFVLYSNEELTDGYYLYSVAAEQFYTASGLSTEPETLYLGTDGGYDGYPWRLYNSSGYYLNLHNNEGEAAGINNWTYVDDGNSFTYEVVVEDDADIESTIEAVLGISGGDDDGDDDDDDDTAYITSLDALTNSTVIILQTARGAAAYDGDNVLGVADEADATDTLQLFVLYTTDDIDGYYLYSVAANAFVGVDTISATPTLFGIGSTGDETYPWYLYTYSDGTDGYDEGTILWLNNNNAGSVVVDDWATTEESGWVSDYLDGGNMNSFVVVATDAEDIEAAIEALLVGEEDTVDLTPLREALDAFYEVTDTCVLGDGLGLYNIPGYTTEEVEESIAMAEAYYALESGQTQELVDSIAELINAGTASLTINLPEAGTYLRIQSLNTSYYVSSDASETYTDYAATVEDGTGDETIFYFDGTHLQSYATGLYAAAVTIDDVSGIAFTADSTDEATDFLFYQFIGSEGVGNRAGAYAIFYADSTYSLSVDANNYAGALTARTGKGLWLAYFLTEVTIEESDDDDTTVEVKDAEALEGKVIASIGEAVSDITAFDGGTWYIFESGGTGRTGYAFVRDDQYYNGGTGDVTAISGDVVATALFRVIPNNDGTYSLVDGLGNYLSVNADWDCVPAAEGDDYTTFNIANPDADTDATVWYIQEATEGTILDTNGPGATMAGWETEVPTSTTGNNAMRFYPVTLEEYETVEMPTGYVITGENATELVDGSWYYINNCPNGSRTGWIYYYGSLMYRNAESAPDDSISVDEASAYLFRADDNGDGTWSLTGGSGYTMSYTSSGVINWDFWNYDYLYEGLFSAAWTIENIDAESDGAAFSALLDGTSYYLDTNGVGYQPTIWAGTPTVDGNECVYFVEVEFVESLDDEDDDEEATVPSLEGKVIASIGEAVTSTDAFDGTTYYLYQTGGDDNAGYAFYSVGGYFNSEIVDITGESAELVAPMLFRVVANEDGSYSLVDGRGHYFAVTNSSATGATAAAEGDDYTTFTIAHPVDTLGEVVADDLFYLQETTAGTIVDTYGTYYSVIGYGTDAPTELGDNTGRFIPVTLEDGETDYVEYPTGKYIETGDAAEELEEGQWYLLNIAPYSSRCGYAYAYNWSSYSMSSHFNDADAPAENSLSDDVAEYMFRLEQNEDGTYNIYNPEGGYMYLYAYWTYSTPTAETTWTIDVIDAETDAACFYALSDCDYYDYEWSLNTNGNGYNVCGWYSTPTDVSSNGALYFIPVTFNDEPSVVDLDALLAAIEALEAYDLGDDLGQYSASDLTTDEIEELLAEATALYESENPTATEVDAMIEELTAAAATVAINVPEAGTFLRIKSSPSYTSVDQPYLGAYNSESKDGRAEFVESAEDDNEAATIFYYDGDYLINYETGYYLTNNSNFLGYNGVTTGSAVSFQAATYTDIGMYNVVFTGTSTSRYLYTNASLYTDAGTNPSGYGYNFELEYVETLPVTTNSLGYATLYTPVAVTLADGATVYEVTLGDDDVLATTAVEADTIGAGSAVLIAGDASTTYSFTIVEAESDAVTGDLTGDVATVESADDAYTLSTESADDVYADADGVILFVLNEGEIQGFTAYLIATSDEDITGIDGATVAADGEDAQIYDLQGRAVSKTVKGGIYIINGKKVYVK